MAPGYFTQPNADFTLRTSIQYCFVVCCKHTVITLADKTSISLRPPGRGGLDLNHLWCGRPGENTEPKQDQKL